MSKNASTWRHETFCKGIPLRAIEIIDTIHDVTARYPNDTFVQEYLAEVSKGLRVRHIPRDDGKPYMTRYAIHGFMPGDKPEDYPLSIYMHHFHSPDYDKAPHSHPWAWARSLILTGGYVERRVDIETGKHRLVAVRPGDLNRIDPTTFHVVEELVGETWTLFSAGPKTNDWGFWNGERVVPWRERIRERGLQPDY